MNIENYLVATCGFMVVLLAACVHPLTIHSRKGDKIEGHYRFARENTGVIQVRFPEDELLSGRFVTVSRGAFADAYAKEFGTGSIAVDGPDVSAYGNAFTGGFASSHTLPGTASGETFSSSSAASGSSVKGPLFFWTAALDGSRGTSLTCFFVGSAYTGHGFGRCKSRMGEEYTAEF
ncbi:MAG TPA: hypothetical protein VIB79_26800 [Candidatus Binatia bacterium]